MPGMREQWDRFAREDPMYFIDAVREDWTEAEFLEAGRRTVGGLLEFAGEEIAHGTVLEIGCGIGRHSAALAERFEQVEAVDISPEMIERARALVAVPNVRFSTVSGSDLRDFGDDSFDLVVSFLVLQHIASEDVIASYLREIARVLRGHTLLQFDTRRGGVGSKLYEALPDALLPRRRRRFMRRYRRYEARVRRLIADAGLEVRRERGGGGPDHLLLLAKMQPA